MALALLANCAPFDTDLGDLYSGRVVTSAPDAGRGGSTDHDASADVSSAGGASGAMGAGGSGGSSGASAAGGAGAGGGMSGGAAGASVSDGAAGSGGAAGSAGSSSGGSAGSADATGGAAGSDGAAGGGGSSAPDGSSIGDAAGSDGSGGPVDGGEEPRPPGAVFAVGSFVKSTATGSQIVPHALGQVPKAVLFWTAGKTNETLSAGFYYGIGVTDGATSGSVAMSARDAMTASWSSRRMARKALTLVQGGEITVAEADLSSLGSTNITLNWTTNDGQPYVVHYLAIGGPEVQAKVVNWQAPGAPGNKVVTGVGFKPEAVLHFHVGGAFVAAPPASQTNGVIGMGVMRRGGTQWSVQVADATGSNPTIATRSQRTDAAIYMYHAPAPMLNKVASFVSMDADGFTLNFITANTDLSQVISLALGGVASDVGAFNKSTDAAPATQAVPGSFKPGAVLLSSYQMAAQTAAVREPHASWGIGASDGTNEGSSAIVDVDDESPSSVDAVDKTSKVFIKMNQTPVDAEAHLASFDPTGFTLSFTVNDAIASQICFLTLGAH